MPRYQGKLGLLKAQSIGVDEHFQGTGCNDEITDHRKRRRAGRGVTPSRVLVDKDVAVADGATTISDKAVLAGQAERTRPEPRPPQSEPRDGADP